MIKVLSAVALFAAAFSVQAQVEIVESQPVSQSNQKATTANVIEQDQNSAEDSKSIQNQMYFQLQTLQQEVLDLRGLVEQQTFELKQLKQQRMEDYLDLDRRLSELSKTGANAARSGPTPPSTVTSTTAPEPVDVSSAPEKSELATYRGAIDLVLKQRDFDGGASALQTYLQEFPRGHYVANAQYWLGQIYFQQGNMDQSQKWFSEMIEQFPQHHKTAEAKYKLAKIYSSKGQNGKAKELLNDVIQSKSSVSKMAKELLDSLN